jgi:hypothetical protein
MEKMRLLLRAASKPIKKGRLPYLIGFVILLLSFTINLFGTGPVTYKDWWSDFQKDSESIITKTVDCQTGENGVGYNGPIQAKGSNVPGCSNQQFKPYASQFGLQSRLIALFAPSGEGAQRYYYLAIMFALALLTALMIIAFAYFVQREFGGITGAVVVGLAAISDWLAAYAPNMYWVAFMMILPFVFSFGFYKWFKAEGKMPLFYGLLGLFFWLKFLNGYEHATTLVLSAFIPIVYYELQRKSVRLVELWRQAALVLGAGVAGIVSAICLNIIGLNSYYHSWPKSFQVVNSRVDERSGTKQVRSDVLYGLEHTLPEVYRRIDRLYSLGMLRDGQQNPVKYIVLSLVNYLLLPAVSLPIIIRDPLGIAVQSILFVGAVSGVLLYRLRRKYRGDGKLRGLWYAYWLGMFGAFSWLVIMPGHAFPHAHINAIVFYMPFLLICYVVLGIAASALMIRPLLPGRGR